KHYSKHDYFKMLLKVELENIPYQLLQKESAQYHAEYPGHAAHYIKKVEFPLIHIHDTGNNGCECSYNGYEARRYDSPSSVFFIEVVRFVQVSFFKEPSVLPVVHTMPESLAGPVAKRIA